MSGGCEPVGSHLYIPLQPETLRIKIGAWPSFRSALSLGLCLVLVCFSGAPARMDQSDFTAAVFKPQVFYLLREGRKKKKERNISAHAKILQALRLLTGAVILVQMLQCC